MDERKLTDQEITKLAVKIAGMIPPTEERALLVFSIAASLFFNKQMNIVVRNPLDT
jgi:hypothetical protein